MTTKVLYSVLGLGVAGVLSICDLCKAPAQAATVLPAEMQLAMMRPAVTPPAAVQPAPAAKTVTLAVSGMTCGGCVVGVRTVLLRLSGVSKADVSYEKGRAVVTYDPAKVTVPQMVSAIKTLNYTATPVPSTSVAPRAG